MLRSSSSICLISCSVGGRDPDPDTCPDPVGEAASPSSSASVVTRECWLQVRGPVLTGLSEPSCCSGSTDAVTCKHVQKKADEYMFKQEPEVIVSAAIKPIARMCQSGVQQCNSDIVLFLGSSLNTQPSRHCINMYQHTADIASTCINILHTGTAACVCQCWVRAREFFTPSTHRQWRYQISERHDFIRQHGKVVGQVHVTRASRSVSLLGMLSLLRCAGLRFLSRPVSSSLCAVRPLALLCYCPAA